MGREPIVRKFLDLPLGTRFRYAKPPQNGIQVWVILSREGTGLIAAWNGIGTSKEFQGICSAEESANAASKLEVEVWG